MGSAISMEFLAITRSDHPQIFSWGTVHCNSPRRMRQYSLHLSDFSVDAAKEPEKSVPYLTFLSKMAEMNYLGSENKKVVWS